MMLSGKYSQDEMISSVDKGIFHEVFRMKEHGDKVVEGRSVGKRIAAGRARVILDAEDMHQLKPGEVLVTDITDPDWEPIMKIASALVTNRGGRTCHAAIIARELGIPAVVGTGNATDCMPDGEEVTVSCAEGEAGTGCRQGSPGIARWSNSIHINWPGRRAPVLEWCPGCGTCLGCS